MHDAEKEYAEARLTAAMVDERPLPSYVELAVSGSAWLGGLAEAASELRRHLLDRLRDGELARSERLLDAMDDAYGLLITIDYPDAVTGGLRRTTDALRAVLERTRGDLTTTVLQSRLQQALERQVPPSILRASPDPCTNLGFPPGGVAQLVERYVRNVEVGGSSPLTSTGKSPGQSGFLGCRRPVVLALHHICIASRRQESGHLCEVGIAGSGRCVILAVSDHSAA